MASTEPVLEMAAALHTAMLSVFSYSEKFEKPDSDDAKLICYKHFQNLNTPTQIKQLFLIGDKISAFKKLLEAEQRLRYERSEEIFGEERRLYYELESAKGPKDKKALKLAEEAQT